MKYLLDFYNSIWEEGIIQESQKKTNDKPMEITLRNQTILYKKSTLINLEEHIVRIRAKAKQALNNMKVVAGKWWGGEWKTLNKLYSAICRLKIKYDCQL